MRPLAPPGGSAVGTLPAPLVQQILANLVTLEFALLVLDAADFRILQGLRVEAMKHRGQAHDRGPAPQSRHPRRRGIDAVPQGRSEPACGLGAVVEAGRTMAPLSAPPPAKGPPLVERIADGIAGMPSAMPQI